MKFCLLIKNDFSSKIMQKIINGDKLQTSFCFLKRALCKVRVWTYDRERVRTLFLSEISIYLSWFLFLYINDFLMVSNQGAFRILTSIVFEIVKSQREENQKRIISGQFFFIFKFFQAFGNLEMDFGINLSKCS